MLGWVARLGGDLLLVVGLGEDRSSEAGQGGGVGEGADDVVCRLIFLLSRSDGLVDRIFFQCGTGRLVNARRSSWAAADSSTGVAEHQFDLGRLLTEYHRDDLELLVDVLGIGLRDDRVDRRGDHLGVALRHHREDVAHECG